MEEIQLRQCSLDMPRVGAAADFVQKLCVGAKFSMVKEVCVKVFWAVLGDVWI